MASCANEYAKGKGKEEEEEEENEKNTTILAIYHGALIVNMGNYLWNNIRTSIKQSTKG